MDFIQTHHQQNDQATCKWKHTFSEATIISNHGDQIEENEKKKNDYCFDRYWTGND